MSWKWMHVSDCPVLGKISNCQSMDCFLRPLTNSLLPRLHSAQFQQKADGFFKSKGDSVSIPPTTNVILHSLIEILFWYSHLTQHFDQVSMKIRPVNLYCYFTFGKIQVLEKISGGRRYLWAALYFCILQSRQRGNLNNLN